jgi:hypothetical protein
MNQANALSHIPIYYSPQEGVKGLGWSGGWREGDTWCLFRDERLLQTSHPDQTTLDKP